MDRVGYYLLNPTYKDYLRQAPASTASSKHCQTAAPSKGDLPLDVDTLTRTLLELSPAGVMLLRPLYQEAQLVDFAYEHLNPAGQQMLHLPAQPTQTFLQYYPQAEGDTGVFTFFRAAFLAGQPHFHGVDYRFDGLDAYYQLAAQRADDVLVVTFTDSADAPQGDLVTALQRRRQVEQQDYRTLAAQQQLLETVFEQAPVALFVLHGPTHIMQVVNPGMSEMLGQPVSQLLGKPYVEAIPGIADQGYPELLAQVWRTGQPVTMQESPAQLARHAPDEVGYFNFVYQPIFDAAGHVTDIICVCVDVTLQVLARQQVQNLNEQLAANNEELYASNEEYQLVNTSLTTTQQQLHQLNAELEGRVHERTREAQTARLEAERQQGELQRVFEQAPVAIFVVHGPTYVIRVVNPAMSEMFGQPVSQLLGKPFTEAIPELTAQGYPELLAQVWHTGQPVIKQESTAQLSRHQPGEVGYFTFVYQPIFDTAGHVTDIMCVALDVTEQVQGRQQVQHLNEELAAINEELTTSNEELHQSNTHLTRANTDLGTFVYTASHDLKAPITNIEGLVLALRDVLSAAGQQDELVAHVLDLLDTTAHRFVTTIGQLTDLSRLQTAYEEPAELLALAPVVDGVLADLAPLIAEAQATVHVQVPTELCVSFAAASLRSIVYNLLSNAVKYRDPQRPAQVWVQAEQQPPGVVLSVRDNGLGLTDSQQQRLFHVFQRLHTHVEGTGVGLYMIKRLIENAGASIAVTSTVDVGTTFTVVFPA